MLRRSTTWKCGCAQRAILRALEEWLERHPRARGMPLRLLRERVGLPKDRFRDAFDRLVERGILEVVEVPTRGRGAGRRRVS